VILSAGVDFETFAHQAETACRAGAVGVLAGRAVWGEAATMDREERLAFFATVGRDRMTTLSRIVQRHARPWTEPDPEAGEIPSDWYVR
jgi:tagatose-1,6-bisphosphate aldolase